MSTRRRSETSRPLRTRHFRRARVPGLPHLQPLLLALLALAACDDSTGPAPEPVDGSNVVLIIVDDLRWDALGATGGLAPTPAMDRLADEGIVFRNAFVVQSVCAPSRASMFTGRYPQAHGVTSNAIDWNGDQWNIFDALHLLGYRIGYVGKWHLGVPTRPRWADRWVSFFDQGEYVDPLLEIDGRSVQTTGHITDILTAHALDFLDDPRSGPFFLILSHKGVHSPFTPQDRWRGTLETADVPLAPTVTLDPAEAYPGQPLPVLDRAWLVDRIRRYYETLRGVDESVGAVLAALDEKGVADSTLVILVGDNGYMLGEHGLIDKRVAYEESMRIPLVVRYPEWFEAGSESEGLALNIDLPSTILHAITGEARSFRRRFGVLGNGLDASLKSIADGYRRSSFLYEYTLEEAHPATPGLRAVRTERFKLIDYLLPQLRDELYDLSTDPRETTNRIDDPSLAGVRDGLRRELATLRFRVGDR